MVILRFSSDDVAASSISIAHTLRAFGPGLNPFAPYGMDYKIDIIMPEEQLGRSLRRNLSSKRMLRSNAEMDDRGWSVLHVRARKGDLKEVRRLLSEGLDANIPAWGPKAQGVTPLHLAAKGGHLKVMDELLEHGANIDARTKGVCGWTPLHKAAKERNREAVKYLIENGAFLSDDINDCRFNPPLHYCSGLEWAYEEVRKLQEDNTSSSGEGSTSES